MDGLSAMKIWHMRCNTGGMFGSYKGKRWAVRFGRKGMGDILALPKKYELSWETSGWKIVPTWFEVKRLGEKQTQDQVIFELEVLAAGHRYAVVHSWEEALEVLNGT